VRAEQTSGQWTVSPSQGSLGRITLILNSIAPSDGPQAPARLVFRSDSTQTASIGFGGGSSVVGASSPLNLLNSGTGGGDALTEPAPLDWSARLYLASPPPNAAGNDITVPVRLESTGDSMNATEVVVSYPADLLSFAQSSASGNWSVVANQAGPGQLVL